MGYSLSLDGDTGGVMTDSSSALYAQSFTKEIWFYKHDLTRGVLFGNYSVATPDGGCSIELSADSKFRIYWNTAALTTIDHKVSINEWHHLSWVRSIEDNYQKVYLNGELIYTHSTAATNYTVNKQNYIGRDSRRRISAFKGLVGEVRIWNTARRDDEIKKNYNKKVKLDEYGLQSYFPLSEGIGLIANNMVDDSKNGTIIGAAEWINDSPPIIFNKTFILTEDSQAFSAKSGVWTNVGVVPSDPVERTAFYETHGMAGITKEEMNQLAAVLPNGKGKISVLKV